MKSMRSITDLAYTLERLNLYKTFNDDYVFSPYLFKLCENNEMFHYSWNHILYYIGAVTISVILICIAVIFIVMCYVLGGLIISHFILIVG